MNRVNFVILGVALRFTYLVAVHRPDSAQVVGHRGAGAPVAKRADLAIQPPPGQPGAGLEPLAKIRLIRGQRARRARVIRWRLQPPLQLLPHRLPVQPGAPSRQTGDFLLRRHWGVFIRH